MRLAMESKLLAGPIEDFGDAQAARVRELGFDGIGCQFGVAASDWAHPDDVTTKECVCVRDLLDRNGLGVAYSWSFYGSLINADDAQRARGVDIARGALRVARDLGAPGVTLGPGSNGPVGPWYPHPENYRSSSLDRLVRSVAELVPAAEEYGVVIYLKGHTLSALDTPEKFRSVLDAVGSSAVKACCDPVNLMRLEHVYRSEQFMNEIFDLLGEDLAVANAKDFVLEGDAVLHLSERPPGLGMMDYPPYVRRYQRQVPDGWMVIEHVELDDFELAGRFLRQIATTCAP